jgi:ABC-type phosphate/phosphonate transport system substrate-binding protein
MPVSLPMYDWPEVRAATDAWWAGLARHLGASGGLERAGDHAGLWLRPDLLFSQTCGYPFTHALCGKVQLLGTPHYRAEGCEGPRYCSIVFARERPGDLGSLRGAAAAVNAPDSMSGMLALKLVFAPHAREGRFFGRTLWTGSHAASMMAVREGAADVCAIDCVCVALARRYRPDLLDGLVEIARSPMVPGLPYVTAASRPAGDVARLRAGIAAAFRDPALAEAREALLLDGLSLLEAADYDVIVELERGAEGCGRLDLV